MNDKSLIEPVSFRGDPARMAALARLASGLAHDLNNLLGAIEGYAALAAGSLPADSQARKDMESVSEAVRAAADLTGRMLIFSRRRALRKEPCAAAAPARAAARVTVTIEISAEPAGFQADGARLGAALAAIVRNALEAMPEGGALTLGAEKVRAPGASGAEEDLLRFFARDTGPGMPPEVLEHAFEPYYSGRQGGKGLGLALVYGVAALHGGWAEARSRPGGGAEISVFIPAS